MREFRVLLFLFAAIPVQAAYHVFDYQFTDYHESELILGVTGDDGKSDSNIWSTYSWPGYQSETIPQSQASLRPYFKTLWASRLVEANLQLPLFVFYSQSKDHYVTESIGAKQTNDDKVSRWQESFSPSLNLAWYPGTAQFDFLISADLRGEQTVEDFSSEWVYPGASSFFNNNIRRHTEHDAYYFPLSMAIKAGVGRLVESRWGWKALELIKDLDRRGLLLKQLNDAEMQELSAILAREGQAFTWDFREMRLHEVKEVATFLVDHEILPDKGVEAVLAIADLSSYPLSSRKNGSSALAYFQWDHESDHFNNRYSVWQNGVDINVSWYNTNYLTVNEAAPAVGIELALSKPISQAWQIDVASRTNYRSFYKYYSGTTAITYDNLAETLNLGISYVPNSRFLLSWIGSSDWGQARHEFAGVPSNWAYPDYESVIWKDSSKINLSWQAAYFVVLTVSDTVNYFREDRSNWTNALYSIYNPGVDDFMNANGSRIYDGNWSNTLSLSMTYRFF